MGKSLEAVFMSAKRCTKRGELDEAKRLYEGVLLQFPNNIRARKGLSELGRTQQGTVLLEDAPPSQVAEAFLALLNHGKFDEAIESGKALRADYPDSVLVHNGLGQAYAALNRIEEAAQSFQSVTNIQPGSAEAQYNLGLLLQMLGHIGECQPRARGQRFHGLRSLREKFQQLKAVFIAKRASQARKMGEQLKLWGGA